MSYKPTIGLEIHVELKTKSKMFCFCKNGLGLEKKPNINICPVCTAQPGSLPVINKEAVKMVLRVAKALNCRLPADSKFDRKNYFYPDLPKGYQISQYGEPLSVNGYLKIKRKKIRIRRVHLEEDTAKLVHPPGADYSLVDFNRAGVPLMELVTEPDITSGSQARQFCQELQLILRSLGVSDADMEKGQMRCEVNISLRSTADSKQQTTNSPGLAKQSPLRPRSEASGAGKQLGTKVEIKNLNSFRAVERAIDYEIKRQSEALQDGERIIQETRGWNEKKQKTISQRGKEEAHDYRYFPEMDLPPLKTPALIKELPSLGELPQQKRARLISQYGIFPPVVDFFVTHPFLSDFFEATVSEFSQTEYYKKELAKEEKKRKFLRLVNLAYNYIMTEFPKFVRTDGRGLEKLIPENFAELMVLAAKGDISSSAAQTVLAEMFKTGADPTHIIQEKDLAQVSDTVTLEQIVDKIIKNNPQPVEDYKKGKENALQFLVGQVMKETKGKANPQVVQEILSKKLTS